MAWHGRPRQDRAVLFESRIDWLPKVEGRTAKILYFLGRTVVLRLWLVSKKKLCIFGGVCPQFTPHKDGCYVAVPPAVPAASQLLCLCLVVQ